MAMSCEVSVVIHLVARNAHFVRSYRDFQMWQLIWLLAIGAKTSSVNRFVQQVGCGQIYQVNRQQLLRYQSFLHALVTIETVSGIVNIGNN